MNRTVNRFAPIFLLAATLLSAAPSIHAAPVPPSAVSFASGLPSDSGVVNVRDFGALGDGKKDDTAAILKAIAAAGPDTGYMIWQDKMVYFPDGTYLISSPLVRRYATGDFASGLVLIGQSEKNTILKLKDHAVGYDQLTKPRPMIFPSSKLLDRSGPTGGGKDYTKYGEGNDAYNNFVENMTVDVGAGNPGAIGIDYLASNMGAIRHVTVTAPAGSGAVGIALTRKWIGPALIDHVTVNGFSIGVDIGSVNYGITMNHVSLNGQTIGLRNNKNLVTANDLVIHSIGSSILNLATDGEIVLAQARLTSQGDTTVKNNAGVIVFHDSYANHSQEFAKDSVKGRPLDGYLTGPAAWTPIKAAGFMPIKDPPPAQDDPVSKWVSVTSFGAVPIPFVFDEVPGQAKPKPPTDSFAAFTAAFASGASTIYVPHGVYYISQNLVIPDTVKRIVGFNSALRVFHEQGYHMNRDQGFFRLISTSDESALQVSHLSFENSNLGTQLALEQSSTRTLVFQDAVFFGTTMLRRSENGGPVFLSDTNSGGRNVILGKAPVTAVQLNVERCDICVTSKGADLNILGVKTELDVTVVDATGGRTQVLGGYIYIVRPNADPKKPAFRVKDGSLTASFMELSFGSDTNYVYYLEDIANGKSTMVEATGFPRRNEINNSRLVPWMQNAAH